MRIKLLRNVYCSGTPLKEGDIVDVQPQDGKTLIQLGKAELVKEAAPLPPAPAIAAVAAPEKKEPAPAGTEKKPEENKTSPATPAKDEGFVDPTDPPADDGEEEEGEEGEEEENALEEGGSAAPEGGNGQKEEQGPALPEKKDIVAPVVGKTGKAGGKSKKARKKGK